MNTIKTLLLLSFSILLFNCSDEEDKEAVKVKAKYKKGTMVLQAIAPDKFSFKKPEE